jgi:hypothetical protein
MTHCLQPKQVEQSPDIVNSKKCLLRPTARQTIVTTARRTFVTTARQTFVTAARQLVTEPQQKVYTFGMIVKRFANNLHICVFY